MKLINSNTEDAHKGLNTYKTKHHQAKLSACYRTDRSALREATESKGNKHSSRLCQVHWGRLHL